MDTEKENLELKPDSITENSKGKLELVALKDFTANEEMYKIVDFLNKSLKDKKIMFGLTKKDQKLMTITIYEL